MEVPLPSITLTSVMGGGGGGEENIIWQVEPRGEGGVENMCQEREEEGGEGRREGGQWTSVWNLPKLAGERGPVHWEAMGIVFSTTRYFIFCCM